MTSLLIIHTPESSRVTERIVSRLGFGKYKFPALPGYP